MAMPKAIRGLGDEEPIRELINKERRYQDGFMERALNPPPKPPSYSTSPVTSRPPTSSALNKLVAIGSVPAGDKLERPLSAKSKMSVRSKRTSAVAQQFRERLDAAEAALKSDPQFSGPEHAHLWAMQKTLLADVRGARGGDKKKKVGGGRTGGGGGGNRTTTTTKTHGPPPSRAGPTGVKSHVARPHTALKVPPGVKDPTKEKKPDGVTGFGARPPTAAPRPLTSATRPGTAAKNQPPKPTRPPTSTGGKGDDIDIVGYTGEPGEQVKPMVLNLDNLEDSTMEVLLHELHKVEEEEEEEEEAAAAAEGEEEEETEKTGGNEEVEGEAKVEGAAEEEGDIAE